jgi:hypothetical protein
VARLPGMICLTLLVLTVPLGAQQADTAAQQAEEYGEEEFSPFLRGLRRGEIIMLGSFPITLFLTLEVYDIYRYIDNIGSSELYRYTPWPVRSPDPAPYNSGEIAGILLTAVTASLLIAVADAVVGRIREKHTER